MSFQIKFSILLSILITIVAASPLEKRLTCDAGNALQGSVCTPCTGLTWAAKGAPKCSTCVLPSGFSGCDHATGKGNTCSTGFYLTSAGTVCSSCPAATWSAKDNTVTSCGTCGPLVTSCKQAVSPNDGVGYWFPTATNCTAGSGFYTDPNSDYDVSPVTCVACSTGFYNPGNFGACRRCLGGPGALCDSKTGVTTSRSAANSLSINITSKAITCTLCQLNSFAFASSVASNCTKCLTSTACDTTNGNALACPASSYMGARNLTAIPQISCVAYNCPIGNSCSSTNGKSLGCLSGWSGVNTTICTNCTATHSYTSSNGTTCLPCNPLTTNCNPSNGDALTCKTGYTVAARNGTLPLGCKIVCPAGQTVDVTGLGCLDCSIPANFKILQCLVPTCSALKLSGVLF